MSEKSSRCLYGSYLRMVFWGQSKCLLLLLLTVLVKTSSLDVKWTLVELPWLANFPNIKCQGSNFAGKLSNMEENSIILKILLLHRMGELTKHNPELSLGWDFKSDWCITLQAWWLCSVVQKKTCNSNVVHSVYESVAIIGMECSVSFSLKVSECHHHFKLDNFTVTPELCYEESIM